MSKESPAALEPVAIAVVSSEDRKAYQLAVTSASAAGDREVKLLPERFTSEKAAERAARKRHPDLPITREPLS